MTTIDILGTPVKVRFHKGRDARGKIDRQKLLGSAQAMAALINVTPWPDIYRDALKSMREIVFFNGAVKVNGHWMDRPCCDEDDAVFYWEIEEFERNMDADVHANTFFHDCWHVVQFRQRGNRFARDHDEQVEREVDATLHQIEVAKLLNCEPHEITHLEAFVADNALIVARLKEGVGLPMHHMA